MNTALFSSSAWRETWWEVYGQPSGLTRSRGFPGDLYIDCYRHQGVPIRCLQFLGTNYRRLATPQAEYNDFSQALDGNLRAALEKMRAERWSEAVFLDLIRGGRLELELRNWAEDQGYLLRVLNRKQSYLIQSEGGFESYLVGLGPNTRLKLYNRRKLLATLGRVELEQVDSGELELFLEQLNRFHRERWGSDCYSPKTIGFWRKLRPRLEKAGGRFELSRLSLDGRCISVSFNIYYEGRLYNIQSGFQENLHPKLAVGTLHFGYLIEAAFADPDIRVFDLLAGGGKNSNYKQHLANRTLDLVSLMIVRSSFHRLLYWLKDWRKGEDAESASAVLCRE